MSPRLMLVVNNGRSTFDEAIEEAKRAGLRVMGVRNTQDALDVVWEHGESVELIATELHDPGDLDDLQILVSDWEHLNVLVFSENVGLQPLLSERIRFVDVPSVVARAQEEPVRGAHRGFWS